MPDGGRPRDTRPGVVPIVDVSAWTAPDAADRSTERQAVARRLDAVCRTVGFAQIVGHGVPDTLIADMLAVTTEFFDQPVEEKRRLLPPGPEVNRGYAPLGSEALAYSLGAEDALPDLFEAFNVGVDAWPAGDPYHEAESHRMFAPNLWPAHPARMRAVWVEYFTTLSRLAGTLMSAFAQALDLPTDYFATRTGRAPNVMRANRYLRHPGAPDPAPGQLRMGAHTDYGACTILLADDVPGLEILGPDGRWHGVRPAPGAFIVNIGDLLARWTNDRWRSTLHRVVPPPTAEHGPALRRSIAFFHEGNHDAVVECLPTCVSADNPARYPAETVADHLMAKLLGPRTLTTSAATSTTIGRA
ncbi:putative Oxidoreductase, 2OG-Fe(II) oxygenase family [Frankia canadensis]|uniref:Putative Oxidoreductase, 2OG-Fe(II) oxygenase family n=1 Tax=Frankia canadensis TaxID=1836972 RepID=A0A2I2KL26_9ACTN|nr:2-oxoglutarate and iron-dependent oxygenase domain-containing protein [Frankia canadensis]SNQ46363.1 putative Oxidoreductase, 2OG-Fe(II) oxygenase family [Frankia canadensis]SOU53653.1 putative Oxidoreductase, 2OG-Fe(II) oxygenase family [Frankia canadensis]